LNRRGSRSHDRVEPVDQTLEDLAVPLEIPAGMRGRELGLEQAEHERGFGGGDFDRDRHGGPPDVARMLGIPSEKEKAPEDSGAFSKGSSNGYFIGVFSGSGAAVFVVAEGAGAASADFDGCFVNTQNCTS